jgi:hypothetical protein
MEPARPHLLQPVPGLVYGDRGEPGRKTRSSAKFPDIPKGGHKGILYDLGRIIVVAGYPEGDVEHLFLVLLYELFERTQIALLGQSHELGIIVRCLLFAHPIRQPVDVISSIVVK